MSKGNKMFVKIVIIILSIPFLLTGFSISLPIVFGQGTPTPPPQELTSPNPNLQYVPQKAYIVPLGPSGQIQAVPIQESSSAIDGGGLTGILGILTAVGTGLWAKMSGSKDNKATNNALLDTKTSQIDLAKYTYSMDPVKAAAITDMPSIKLETMENQKKDLQEKAVKS